MKNKTTPPTPYAFGFTEVRHKNAVVTTIVGDPSFDNFLLNYENNFSFKEGFVPAGYEHRADLIANLFLNDSNLWWLVLLVNNLNDPFEGLNIGDKIIIPIKK